MILPTVIIAAAVLAAFVALYYLAGWLGRRYAASLPEDWTLAELEEAAHPCDPLTRPLSDVELDAPHLFDELAEIHSIRLDWAPPTFSQTWKLAGDLHRDLGDTAQMAAVR